LRKAFTTAVAMLAVLMWLTLTTAPLCRAENSAQQIIDEALGVLERLQALSEKGLNVSKLAEELNEALDLAQAGDLESAKSKLASVEDEVSRLEAEADRYYAVSTAVKYAKVVGLLLIPVAFFFLFPRVYLYIWFKSRRRWVVGGSAR